MSGEMGVTSRGECYLQSWWVSHPHSEHQGLRPRNNDTTLASSTVPHFVFHHHSLVVDCYATAVEWSTRPWDDFYWTQGSQSNRSTNVLSSALETEEKTIIAEKYFISRRVTSHDVIAVNQSARTHAMTSYVALTDVMCAHSLRQLRRFVLAQY